MMELEEIFLLKNVAFTTDYQTSLSTNILQFDFVDFFIYIYDDEGGTINTVDCIIEYTGKLLPLYHEWATMSFETFDSDLQVFNLKDYVVRKEITEPTSFSIRIRAQGHLMAFKIKANAPGGNFSITALKRKRNK